MFFLERKRGGVRTHHAKDFEKDAKGQGQVEVSPVEEAAANNADDEHQEALEGADP